MVLPLLAGKALLGASKGVKGAKMLSKTKRSGLFGRSAPSGVSTSSKVSSFLSRPAVMKGVQDASDFVIDYNQPNSITTSQRSNLGLKILIVLIIFILMSMSMSMVYSMWVSYRQNQKKQEN